MDGLDLSFIKGCKMIIFYFSFFILDNKLEFLRKRISPHQLFDYCKFIVHNTKAGYIHDCFLLFTSFQTTSIGFLASCTGK